MKLRGTKNLIGSCLVTALLIVVLSGTSIAKADVKVTGVIKLGGYSKRVEQYCEASRAEGDNARVVSLLSETAKIPDNVAIANVSERLNIRKGPGTDYDVVAYLGKNAYCFIVEQVDEEWVLIESDGIAGYVSLEYLYVGEEAQRIAEELGTVMVTVEAERVNLRSEPSSLNDGNIITKIYSGEKYEVIEDNIISPDDEEAPLWVKVIYKGQIGYVCKSLVDVSYQWNGAEKVESRRSTSSGGGTPSGRTYKAPEFSGDETIREKLIALAESACGERYWYGHSSLKDGTDCSGLVCAVYNAAGINLPREGSATMVGRGKKISRDELKPGDLVFYARRGVIFHVAIYYGNGQIIHASSSNNKVMVASIDCMTPYCYRRLLDD